MRQIGTIPDGEQAERFADFLRGLGMPCSLDSSDNGWAVWIQDEDHVAAAKQELTMFLADPDQERYRHARRLADTRLQEELQRRKIARRNQISLRSQWDRPVAERCPLTIGLLAACAIVAYFTRLGGTLAGRADLEDVRPLIEQLSISTNGTWKPILSGEVWRIWSPMFLHFGWLHLLFNGLWLKDFGFLLESRLGTVRFLLLVLAVGAAANLVQFFMTQRPEFGGMSGVVYGLFGYLWMRGKLDPNSGLGVSEQTVMWMIVWFVICFVGLIPHVANWNHAGGLATGVALGALAAMRKR